MTDSFLRIRGCRQHNLKNISLDIPKLEIVSIVGVSGSGKSSLAFDTIFAEGQRRYLEYLSPQTRALIKQMPKPDVDMIDGLSPALAISQGKQRLSSRGNVATFTDIYDFLSLLYSHIGEQHSPFTGKKLTRYSRQEIIELILKEYPPSTKIQLLAPVKWQEDKLKESIEKLQQMGFIRFKINGLDWTSEDPLPAEPTIKQLDVVVDRIEMKEDIRDRLSSSVETAMDLSRGILKVQEGKTGIIRYFTEVYVCPETNYSFAPLGPADFNFNSVHGACQICQGLGELPTIQPDLLYWDQQTPVSEQIEEYLNYLPRKLSQPQQQVWIAFLEQNQLTENLFVNDISKKIMNQILHGSSTDLEITVSIDEQPTKIKTTWKGLIPIYEQALQDKKNRAALSESPLVKWNSCPSCKGGRLKPESLFCLIHGKGIHELCAMTVSNLIKTIHVWKFKGKQATIAEEIIPHVLNRLQFLEEVGLGYLELDRKGQTLSDGEVQRVQLASQIGAKLSGLLYILDEPSLGLHRQDIGHLRKVIRDLKNLGNTVILVEHEPHLIQESTRIIELGPGAGTHGGEIVFQGFYEALLKDKKSLTGKWLSGALKMPAPPKRKLTKEKLSIKNASLHNIKNLSLEIPLKCLVAFCGVSGSGKSTLVQDIISEEVRKELLHPNTSKIVTGAEAFKRIVLSQKQNESFSSRSIPATFIDVMTPIRNLFAETKLAKARGYTASRFSLQKRGGRCEACEGLGVKRISMQLMPDIFVPCDLCLGQRYNYETLQITWENLNIAEILNLSIEQAYTLFRYHPAIAHKLELMKDLGLEYLTLGQQFNTLSSGEIQRLRLVADIATKSLEQTLYILDEPSAGLHFQDISKLLQILHKLVDQGHSVFIVEHHLSLLEQADWLIELGPGGGPAGGQVIFEGTSQKIKSANTPTGRQLK